MLHIWLPHKLIRLTVHTRHHVLCVQIAMRGVQLDLIDFFADAPILELIIEDKEEFFPDVELERKGEILNAYSE